MNKFFNRTFRLVPLTSLTFLATSASWGQGDAIQLTPDSIAPVPLVPRAALTRGKFDFSYRMGFNVQTRFRHVGGFAPGTDPGPATGLANHIYDDGYNLLDSTGNQHFNGVDFTQGTWFWGFDSFSQVNNNGAETGTIDMHSDSSNGAASSDKSSEPEHGFELSYSKQLGAKDRWRWGVSGAFNYTRVDIRDSSSMTASLNRLTDTYSLMGTSVPQQDNYSQDSFGDPNHVIIGDVPTRTFSSVAMPIDGWREFNADIFGFKFGPYLEYPISPAVSITLDTGLTLVYTHSHFSFNETISTPGGPVTTTGSGDHSDALVGGYVGGHVTVQINERWSAFAGANWQSAGTYNHRAGGGTRQVAMLDLSNMISVNVGVGFNF